jgi:hypothetical protein
VPPDDGLRPHQDEVTTPGAADPAHDDPEQLVAGAHPGALAGGPRQDGELVAQERVLDDEIAAATERRPDAGEQEGEYLEHARRIADPAPGLLQPGFCRLSAAN